MPRGRKKNRILPTLKLKPDTVKSIFFIFFLILAILSVFSFLQQGTIATDVNLALNKFFGWGAVMVPFLFLLISFLFTKVKSPLREANVFFGFCIMFFALLGLFKQGLVGSFFWEQFLALFSEAPTFIIFFFALIVGFVVLFDTNIAQIFKFFANVFNTIRRYSIGQATKLKNKKSKDLSKNPLYQSEMSSPNSDPFAVKEKDYAKSNSKADLGVVNIAPVFKDSPPLTSSGSQPWVYPSMSLFDDTPGAKADRGDVRKNAQIIEQTLDSFGITARVAEVNNSPSVTQYALEVALGTKLAKILSLSNDLAMALAAPGGQIRVEAPIPGRSLVGIEMPNRSLEVVPIRTILESDIMKNAKSKITIPLGLDVAGLPKIADISKMPHVLIAGQTGSGKSICINSWISTLLFRASPDEVRLIMVDPKRVELSQYNGIPHLLTPVIVEPEKVVSALKWAVNEMERRYKLFTEVGAKNIDGYNDLSGFQSIPYILIVIDELAEIMLFSPAEVEDNICRIAQMARATGIHLVLATQRPSVNIITGLIKANIPTRIAFAVASMTDSRVVLDTPGAEKLLGRGDMLYIPPDLAKPVRIQGCFISDKEVNRLIDFLKTQRSGEYNDEITKQPVNSPNSSSKNIMVSDGEERDAMFEDAVKLIQETGKASASLMQRKLKLGYARAARVLDELEKAGIVGPVNGAKPREILIAHRSPSDNISE
ncbi:MAG: cell division FtsK/SpoIIIE [Candidatus Shapirobacteria bacterium GW2011_GWE1_38_10]|uniref:Cell division FtsK/SpoIIIE n=1 Tax=Candidatus Shapirobacteria bacterium GW2011_GWE1_38_10 TaxID=1618488 RepID=A0A0G0I5X3_9BACT|nr:MAG: cell division FtsK/SpoIIIE [Candidatus Shapirobacteria bacterium GW2011_GWF2_37_20]KKQ49967.1 MAG: cell division FtsK/SpoIIIE [Candidatus Shapirobacteria bacterium GW2011_GWE1_38_10]KKQ63953.1 MAG: cell division FtsK/SpoIIIE [Candidatus Shapirobacteria bacterium GW2011_GWF1_38_23]HBP51489.1 DNA translocase FtsK [Candidatus Shapirobacteria bacterium]